MDRDQCIQALIVQGQADAELRELEELAACSDELLDAVGLVTAQITNPDDNSYEVVEGTEFPVRIRTTEAGLRILAANIHDDLPGEPRVVWAEMPWERMTLADLQNLAGLIEKLAARGGSDATAQLEKLIAEQQQLVRYRIRYRDAHLGEVVERMFWAPDEAGTERDIRDRLGGKLVSCERIGRMELT